MKKIHICPCDPEFALFKVSEQVRSLTRLSLRTFPKSISGILFASNYLRSC